jgi:serine/threonine protein kinase HipA of HipAB toxin-antitoxin module
MYSSAQKYDDSYKNIAKRLKNFESPVHQNQALADFFKILALSCAVKNGDTHLKNFDVLSNHGLPCSLTKSEGRTAHAEQAPIKRLRLTA